MQTPGHNGYPVQPETPPDVTAIKYVDGSINMCYRGETGTVVNIEQESLLRSRSWGGEAPYCLTDAKGGKHYISPGQGGVGVLLTPAPTDEKPGRVAYALLDAQAPKVITLGEKYSVPGVPPEKLPPEPIIRVDMLTSHTAVEPGIEVVKNRGGRPNPISEIYPKFGQVVARAAENPAEKLAKKPHRPPNPDNPFEGLAEGITNVMREAVKRNQRRANGVKTPRRFEGNSPKEVYPFGKFHERLDYMDGLVISEELMKGTKALGWTLRREDGTTREVKLGPTPAMYHPRTGGTELHNAGEPGELILGVAEPGQDMKFKYLDFADVEGVEVVPGQEVIFANNNARHRVVKMQQPSKVEPGIVGFR